jgi:hypothetical protein
VIAPGSWGANGSLAHVRLKLALRATYTAAHGEIYKMSPRH